MAIATTTPACKVGFIVNATTADASGCETIKAAVTAKKIKIRHLTINSDGAVTVTIGEGETAGAVTTELIGPVQFAANQTMQWDFNPLMELTAATALTVDAGGAANLCIFVQGIVE